MVYSTQEDPIGLAGGLNLYGYAGGDPINNSDPFGLCPMCAAVSSAIGALKLPYSTGGKLADLSPEAIGVATAIGTHFGKSLGISATVKVSGDPRHASGHAFDVNEIGGVDIGSKGAVNSTATMLLANSVAEGALADGGVRAVIWPTGYVKSESFGGSRVPQAKSHRKQWFDHQDHLHISVYTADERKKKP